MNEQKLSRHVMLAILIIITAGCGSSDKEAVIESEPIIETKSLVEENPVITITFDGETCDHQGPEITNGDEVLLIYHGLELPMNYPQFRRLEDGKTWEDFLTLFPNDGVGGEASDKVSADWLKPVAGMTGENEGEKIFSIKPGKYVTWCRIPLPLEVYPGGLLIVEE